MKFQTVTFREQYPGFVEHQFLCAVQQSKYLSNSQCVIILAWFRDYFHMIRVHLTSHKNLEL